MKHSLLIATANKAKQNMFYHLLKNEWIDLVTLDSYGHIQSPNEDGNTIEENAFLKAKYYSEHTGLPAISDDAWLSIPWLHWAPWIMARRWWWILPDSISDEEWMLHFQKEVSILPDETIEATIPFCRCLYLPDGRYFFQKESLSIQLTKSPRNTWKKWWPMSAFCIYPDGRHQMDVPENDPIQETFLYKDGLVNIIKNLWNGDFFKNQIHSIPLKENTFSLFGSGPMGIRWIRKSKDVDILVDTTTWKILSDEYNHSQSIEPLAIMDVEIWHTWPWFTEEECKKIIAESEIYDWLPFARLQEVIKSKQFRNKEKDNIDLTLISEWTHIHNFL